MAAAPPPSPLPKVHRYITTHNATTGTPTFETGVPEPIAFETSPLGADMFLAWSGTAFPAALANDADLDSYKGHLATPPQSFMIPGGFLARYIDYHPTPATAPDLVWHRTVTLDFGVVIEGQIELLLEGGETRILDRGDVIVQRGTLHAWRNPSSTDYARVFYVALDSQAPVVKGVELGEQLGLIAL